MQTTSSRLLTIAQVAERLSETKAKVYVFVRSGQLRSVRTSPRSIRVTEAALEEFIARLEADAAEADDF